VALALPARGIGPPRVQRHAGTAAAVLAVGALVAISAASHAAAAQDVRTPALAADVLHLLAASAWAGGLPLLLLASVVLRRTLPAEAARAALAAMVPRFSLVAATSVVVLVVTGLYSGWVQV